MGEIAAPTFDGPQRAPGADEPHNECGWKRGKRQSDDQRCQRPPRWHCINRPSHGRVGLGGVTERLVDPSRKEAFETAKGFAVGQSVLLAAAHIGFGRFVGSALRHRRAMDDSVQFPVAEATETVSRLACRGRLDRGSAGVGGKMGLRAKGALADKPDDLAGRKRAQAVDRDEIRVMLFCQRLDLACEGGDAPGYKSHKVLADDAEINQSPVPSSSTTA